MAGYYYPVNEVALEESFATSLEAGAILIPDVCLDAPCVDAQMRTYDFIKCLCVNVGRNALLLWDSSR